MLESPEPTAFRYVKSMRLLQRLRDEEWWAQTMADLRPKLQQSKQPQRRLGHPSSSKASTLLAKPPSRIMTSMMYGQYMLPQTAHLVSFQQLLASASVNLLSISESRNEKHGIGLK